MKKIAIDELQALRTSIVNFHQNMKILYNDLYQASGKTPSNKIIFEMYHPLLESVKTAGVFGATFTLPDVQEHLQYLIGIIRSLASANVLDAAKLTQQYGEVAGSDNLAKFGLHIQESFVPLATALSVPADEAAMIEKAPTFSDLLNKVGANVVTYVRQYTAQMTTAQRTDYLLKWATLFEALYV